PHEKVDVREVADVAACLDVLDRAIPGLPPEVLVHHEAHTGALLDDSLAGLVAGRKRLLTDDVDPARSRKGAHLFVCFRRGDDVDKVGPFTIQHVLPVLITAADAVLRHQGPGALFGPVVNPDDVDLRNA